MKKEVAEVLAKFDGKEILTKTIEQILADWGKTEVGKDWDEPLKREQKMFSQFFEMCGIDKEVSILSWICSNGIDGWRWEEAIEVIERTDGWWMYWDDEMTYVFLNGERIADMTTGRGYWDCVVRGDRFIETEDMTWKKR